MLISCLALLSLSWLLKPELVQAQEEANVPDFTIQFRAQWDTDNPHLLQVFADIQENNEPVHGPYLENPLGNQTDDNWHLQGYFYQYIANSRFNCNNDIADEFLALDNATAQDRWLTDHYLEDDWLEQEAAFWSVSPKYLFKMGDNNWEGSVQRNINSTAKNSSAKLAYCLQVKRHDGSDATLNNIVLDFSNLGNSTTNIEATNHLPNIISSAVTSNSSSDNSTNSNSTNSSNNQNNSSQNDNSDDEQTTDRVANKTVGKTPDLSDNDRSPLWAFLTATAIIATIAGAWIYSKLRRYRP